MTNDETQEEQGPNIKAPEKKRGYFIFDTWFGKWAIYRIPATLTWYWFILRFLNKLLPFGIEYEREYLLIPALFAWLLLLLFGRWLRLILYPLYIFFFPFVIVWLVILFIAIAINIPVQVVRFARSGRLIYILFLVAVVGWVVTVLANNPEVKASASLSALIAIYLLFLQSFRWAANPYKPLLGFCESLSGKGRSFMEKVYIKPGLEKEGQPRQTAITVCNWGIKAIEFLYPQDGPLERGITGFTRTNLVPTAIFGFVLLYTILASSFSISLYEIEKAWGPQISGLAESPTLSHYFYFSFLSQATAVPDGIRPISTLGQFWIVWVVMTGVLLLTVLLGMFTTSVGIHGESTLKGVREYLDRGKMCLEDWVAQLELFPKAATESGQGQVINGEFKAIEPIIEDDGGTNKSE